MVIGVTGSRLGATEYQLDTFKHIIDRLNIDVFHHGMCKGVDKICSDIVRLQSPDTYIIAHPPLIDTYIAENVIYDKLEDKYEYLERNKHIVDNCNLLIALPNTDKEQLRSGTFSTIRYAKKKGMKVIIIYPKRIEVIDNI